MQLLTLFVLAIFSFLLLSQAILLLRRLHDGGDGFFRTLLSSIHFFLLLLSIEMVLLLCLLYLFITPGEASRTLALASLVMSGMIAVRALATRRVLLGLAYLSALLLSLFLVFPALEGWVFGLL